MIVASQCPDSTQLQQLLLGSLSGECMERLEMHVLQCKRCGPLLPTLQARDPLADSIGVRPRPVLTPADAKAIQCLVARLRGLREPRSPDPDPIAADDTQTDVQPFNFLSPPQSRDEIGRLGPYRVLRLLGQGGMGMVFVAEDPHLQRIVALKTLLPKMADRVAARERFLQEARAMAKVEHDHIVAIFQVGEDRGVPYLAMPLLEGMSLEDCLRKKVAARSGPVLTVEQILKLGREVARGLAAAHDKGLIHRDIKPANIWLDASACGRVKILDFGLVRAAEGGPQLTRLGGIVGTAAYMAPEQARGQKVDGRADLFSLGCVLYRLCSGRLPWQAKGVEATMVAMATEPPMPLQELSPCLPPKLAGLVMQLLAQRAEDRPVSARAVANAIQVLEREPVTTRQQAIRPAVAFALPVEGRHGPPAHPANPARPVHESSVRHKLLWAFAAGAGMSTFVLTAAGIYLATSVTPSRVPEVTKEGGGGPAAPATNLTNSIGMKLRYIPAGKFLMGSSAVEIERFKKEPFGGYVMEPREKWGQIECPQHAVQIARGYYLGVYEVTQGQFQKVMGTNPSANKASPDHPVEMVTWDEAVDFCKKLSALAHEKQAQRLYRLPTEAEWEYACRAGTTAAFHQGNSLSSLQANIDADHPFGTAEKGPQIGKTAPVGSYAPNDWGLYDMYGNVWEWCLDGMRSYTADEVADPRGPDAVGGWRVLRGGGWGTGACRSALRKERPASYSTKQCGLRVVCE
jgi:eukaryotic-like serine/threonine-protein kinase